MPAAHEDAFDIRLRLLSGKVVRHSVTSRDTVKDLRVAAEGEQAAGTAGNAAQREPQVTLIHKGKTLTQDTVFLFDIVSRNDIVLVVPARKAPPANLRPLLDVEPDDEDDDVALTRPPPDASWLHKRVGMWLKHTCHAPDEVMAWFYLIKPWVWLAVLIWMLVAPITARFGFGSIYVLASILVVMLCNLRRKRRGEVSAYSIFNEGIRQLPGELTAEQVDAAFRNRM